MKAGMLALAGVFLCSVLAAGQSALHPVPPGVREADKLPSPADNVPAALNRQSLGRRVEPAQLQRQADELAKQAQLISIEVGQVQSGRFPAGLVRRLKNIEKMSKQLRRELSGQ